MEYSSATRQWSRSRWNRTSWCSHQKIAKTHTYVPIYGCALGTEIAYYPNTCNQSDYGMSIPTVRTSLKPGKRHPWLVYQSNESGKNEVYVTAFPFVRREVEGFAGRWDPSQVVS